MVGLVTCCANIDSDPDWRLCAVLVDPTGAPQVFVSEGWTLRCRRCGLSPAVTRQRTRQASASLSHRLAPIAARR